MRPVRLNDRQQLADVWKSPETPATVLLGIAIDLHGPEVLDWEPETLKEALHSSLDIEVSQREVDRFLALKTALTTNMAYTDVITFHHTINALNGSQAVFNTWDPIDLDELTWGLTELMLNDRPTSDQDWASRFSSDVKRYVGLIIEQTGSYIPNAMPAVIKSIAEYASGSNTADTDPTLYAVAYENSTTDVRDAEQYAQSKLDDTLTLLNQLPLSKRSEGWLESAREVLVNVAQS